MKRFCSFAVFILLSAAPQLWAAADNPKTAPNVFEAFHQLDEHFTALDTQFHDLQHALNSGEPHTPVKRDWQHAARNMRDSTAQIRRITYRAYRPYRAHHALAYRMFFRLHSRARVLQERLLVMSRARSKKVARREETNVAKAMLDLVLQYQAVSGGYAAATCNAGAWSCGVPKKEPRKVGYPALGVKWTCVKQRASCHGILGPHSPMLTEPPLTANSHSQ